MRKFRVWIRRLEVLIACAVLGAFAVPQARASELHLELGLVPLASGPAAYPTAFSSVGYTLGLAYYWDSQFAIWGEGRLEGSGSWVGAGGRYFFFGGANIEPLKSGERATLRLNTLGFFVDAGAAIYNVSSTLTGGGTSSDTGAGLVVNLGLSFPLFGRFAGLLKGGTMNSGGSVATYYGQFVLDYAF